MKVSFLSFLSFFFGLLFCGFDVFQGYSRDIGFHSFPSSVVIFLSWTTMWNIYVPTKRYLLSTSLFFLFPVNLPYIVLKTEILWYVFILWMWSVFECTGKQMFHESVFECKGTTHHLSQLRQFSHLEKRKCSMYQSFVFLSWNHFILLFDCLIFVYCVVFWVMFPLKGASCIWLFSTVTVNECEKE